MNSQQLITTLKRELKNRELTYSALAQRVNMSEAELVQALGQLDRMGFLSLQPYNRFTLKLSRTFHWIPNGPIQDFFRAQSSDYLSREFTRPGESFQVVNVLLSQASAQKIAQRLRDLAQEINALHLADSRLPYTEKGAQTMLLALRPWIPPFLRALRQQADKAAV